MEKGGIEVKDEIKMIVDKASKKMLYACGVDKGGVVPASDILGAGAIVLPEPAAEYDALRLTQGTQIKLLELAINTTLNNPIKVISIERDYHVEGGILVSYKEVNDG